VEIRPITVDEVRAGASVLARAFLDDTHFVALVPAASRRARALPYVMAALVGDSQPFGTTYGAFGGAGELVSLAVFLPPVARRPTLRRQLRSARSAIGALAAGPSGIRRLSGFAAGLERRRPVGPHWYLAAIGSLPGHRGGGNAGRLLRHGLGVADADGRPCYLETQTSRLADWYRLAGFEQTGEERYGPIVSILMTRAAARPDPPLDGTATGTG
jgi:GNAT superfamily N-acetyltransferase